MEGWTDAEFANATGERHVLLAGDSRLKSLLNSAADLAEAEAPEPLFPSCKQKNVQVVTSRLTLQSFLLRD